MVVGATRRVPPSGKVATPARWVFATSIFCNFVLHYWRLSNNYIANMKYSIGCWASTMDAIIMDHGLKIFVSTSCFSVPEDSGSVHKRPVPVSVLLGGRAITGDLCSFAICNLLFAAPAGPSIRECSTSTATVNTCLPVERWVGQTPLLWSSGGLREMIILSNYLFSSPPCGHVLQ